MQPVTASVPASARARSRASAARPDRRARRRGRLGLAPPLGAPAHDDDDGLDLLAHGEREQQRAAEAGGGDARQGGGQLAGADGEHALAGARDPGDAGRALGAGDDVAETALAAEQVGDDRLALLCAPLGGEMVHVHLIGADQREQLMGERAKDGLGLGAAVGEPHQAAQPAEQRVAVGGGDGTQRDIGTCGGHRSDFR